jgi:hypothetical protein
MSIANILNNNPLGKQIEQPNLTVDNLLTVKDINCSGVINATTLAVDNLSLYTQQEPYTGDSATLNYQNADFSLGKITALDTSIPPNGTYYSKLQLKPQLNDTTPELFFVGRDANADNTTRQIGAFVRSRNVVGQFTTEARLGLTNIEPDGLPPVLTGETYAFRVPQAGGTDALTLTAFDNTGAGSQKDVLNVLPSGARPYQTYQTTVAGNVVKLMSDQTAGVIVANSAAPNVFGTVYDSNITPPVQFMPRTGFPNQYIVSGVVAPTLGSQGFEFTVPATGMYMLTTSFISAKDTAPYTNTTNPIAGDCIEVIWEQAGTSIDTITGSTFIYCSELPPVPVGNTYYGKTYTTVAYCQQGEVNMVGAYIFNLNAGVSAVGSYNIRMVLTRMCGLGGYTIPPNP